MTTIDEQTRTCAVCGETIGHTVVGSTNAFGSPDLDLRPPEMERSTIDYWIQACPTCGFCSPDISEAIPGGSESTRSDAYQRQLNNSEFPELVNRFLCHSILQENAGNLAQAGWSAVYASWAADDAELDSQARKCRDRAVTLLQEARSNGETFGGEPGAEEALLADLLRRSARFEAASSICNEGVERGPSDVLADVLRFQQTLIRREDTGCHSIEEALEK